MLLQEVNNVGGCKEFENKNKNKIVFPPAKPTISTIAIT